MGEGGTGELATPLGTPRNLMADLYSCCSSSLFFSAAETSGLLSGDRAHSEPELVSNSETTLDTSEELEENTVDMGELKRTTAGRLLSAVCGEEHMRGGGRAASLPGTVSLVVSMVVRLDRRAMPGDLTAHVVDVAVPFASFSAPDVPRFAVLSSP